MKIARSRRFDQPRIAIAIDTLLYDDKKGKPGHPTTRQPDNKRRTRELSSAPAPLALGLLCGAAGPKVKVEAQGYGQGEREREGHRRAAIFVWLAPSSLSADVNIRRRDRVTPLKWSWGPAAERRGVPVTRRRSDGAPGRPGHRVSSERV